MKDGLILKLHRIIIPQSIQHISHIALGQDKSNCVPRFQLVPGQKPMVVDRYKQTRSSASKDLHAQAAKTPPNKAKQCITKSNIDL